MHIMIHLKRQMSKIYIKRDERLILQCAHKESTFALSPSNKIPEL